MYAIMSSIWGLSLKEANQAEKYAEQESAIGGRDFLKKIGSNFRLSGQKLFLDFKNPFKILAEAEPRLWRGEAVIAQNPNSENWRRGRDLNQIVLAVGQGFPA